MVTCCPPTFVVNLKRPASLGLYASAPSPTSSTVVPLSVILPVTVKCASLRSDCCGLARTSFAVGAAGVGTPHPAASAATPTTSSKRRSGGLTLHHLGGRGCRDRLARVVLVKAEVQRIALLGDLVFDRVAVAFANPAVKLVAVLVLGLRVPGFTARQIFLSDIGEIRGAGKAVTTEAGSSRLRGPLAVTGHDQCVVNSVDGNVLVADLLPGNRGLEFEPPGPRVLVDQYPIAVDVHRDAAWRRADELAGYDEMRVAEVGMKRFGQDVLGARGSERRTGSAAGGQQADGRHRDRDSNQSRDHYC